MSRSNERPGRLPGDGPRYGERRDGRAGSSYRGRDRDQQGGRYGERRDQRGGGRGYQGGREEREFGRDDRRGRPGGYRSDYRSGPGSYRDRDRDGGRGDRGGYRDRDDFGRGGRERRPYGDRDDARRGYGHRDRDDQRRPASYRDREGGFGDRRDRSDRPQRPYGRGRDERASRPEGRGFRDRDGYRRDDRGRSRPGDRSGGYGYREREGDRRDFGRDRGVRPFSQEGYREREKARSIRARYGRSADEAESPAPSAREELPEVPADITPDQLDKEVREGLLSLPKDLANLIAVHLLAAERALAEEDAERAYEHAKVARRFGSRVGVVREAAGIAAYRAGRFAEALNDLRAARRLMGADDLLPILADCERGLGRPERALDLIRSSEAERVGRAVRIELAIVESGARRDLGQKEAAVVTLQRLPELRDDEPRPWSARLAFAYADALADAGQEKAAADWFYRAMAYDENGETDAAVRYAELTGTPIDEIEDVEEDADEADLESAEARADAPGDEEGAGAPGDAAEERAEPDDGPGAGPAEDPAADSAAGSVTGSADAGSESAAGEAAQDAKPGAGAVQPGEPAEAAEPGRFAESGAEEADDESRSSDPEPDEATVRSESPAAAAEAGPAASASGSEDQASHADTDSSGKAGGLEPAFIEPDFGGEEPAGTAAPGKREA